MGTAAHSCCCSVREGFAPFSQIGVSLGGTTLGILGLAPFPSVLDING